MKKTGTKKRGRPKIMERGELVPLGLLIRPESAAKFRKYCSTNGLSQREGFELLVSRVK